MTKKRPIKNCVETTLYFIGIYKPHTTLYNQKRGIASFLFVINFYNSMIFNNN